MLDTAARSEHTALIIALGSAVALGWGWWRREGAHSARYDTLLDALRCQDEEVAALAREAFEVLRDVAAALAGMERTLEGLDSLVHVVLNSKLHGADKDERCKN